MSVITKNGEYENLNFKNMEPGQSLTLKITGSKDFTKLFDGEESTSTLFFSKVGSVTAPDNSVVEEVNREVSFFVNHKTKWSKPLYDAFSSKFDAWFKVTLTKIELVKHEVRGKKIERYAPVFVVSMIDTPEDAPVSEQESTPSLPMPKPIFIQVCKTNGLSYGDSFVYEGVSYQIRDYVSESEYSS